MVDLKITSEIKIEKAPITVKDLPITHLEDGAYAEYQNDGAIRLMANDHKNPTDIVYLTPHAIENLIEFIKKCEQERV